MLADSFVSYQRATERGGRGVLLKTTALPRAEVQLDLTRPLAHAFDLKKQLGNGNSLVIKGTSQFSGQYPADEVQHHTLAVSASSVMLDVCEAEDLQFKQLIEQTGVVSVELAEVAVEGRSPWPVISASVEGK